MFKIVKCPWCNQTLEMVNDGFDTYLLPSNISDPMNDIKVYKDNSTYSKIVQKEEPENMSWRNWLNTIREQIRKEANLK